MLYEDLPLSVFQKPLPLACLASASVLHLHTSKFLQGARTGQVNGYLLCAATEHKAILRTPVQ